MAAVDAFKVRAIIEAGYDKTSLNRANADVQASYRKLSSKMKQVNAVARATQASVSIMGAAAVKVTSFGRTDIISKNTLNMYSVKIDIVDSVLVKNPFNALMGVIKGTTTRHEAMMSLANADLTSFL